MNSTNPAAQLLTTSAGPADGLPGDAHFFKSIFECSAAGLLVIDANNRCVSVNQAFCDLLGYTVQEVLGKTMFELTHPDDIVLSVQALRRLATGEAKGCQIEKRYIHKSGRPVWVLLTATLIPQADRLQPDLLWE